MDDIMDMVIYHIAHSADTSIGRSCYVHVHDLFTLTTLLLVIASYSILLKRPVLDKIKAKPSVNYSSSDL